MTDTRRCRVCNVPGLVHLDRDPTEGPTENPLVECPRCGRTWIAQGTQFILKLPPDGTEEEVEAALATMVEQIRAHPPEGQY